MIDCSGAINTVTGIGNNTASNVSSMVHACNIKGNQDVISSYAQTFLDSGSGKPGKVVSFTQVIIALTFATFINSAESDQSINCIKDILSLSTNKPESSSLLLSVCGIDDSNHKISNSINKFINSYQPLSSWEAAAVLFDGIELNLYIKPTDHVECINAIYGLTNTNKHHEAVKGCHSSLDAPYATVMESYLSDYVTGDAYVVDKFSNYLY